MRKDAYPRYVMRQLLIIQKTTVPFDIMQIAADSPGHSKVRIMRQISLNQKVLLAGLIPTLVTVLLSSTIGANLWHLYANVTSLIRTTNQATLLGSFDTNLVRTAGDVKRHHLSRIASQKNLTQ